MEYKLESPEPTFIHASAGSQLNHIQAAHSLRNDRMISRWTDNAPAQPTSNRKLQCPKSARLSIRLRFL